jgi:tRNA-dihydrouridine synthase
MIGRGVLGNPWLIRECVDYLENGKEPTIITISEKIAMIKKHLQYLLDIKPYKVAILEIRSHAAWYLKGLPEGKDLKRAIFTVTEKEDILNLLDEYEKARVIDK